MPLAVRIIKTPFGPAPDWVRDVWVGLVPPTTRCKAAQFGIANNSLGPVSLVTALRVMFGLEGRRVRGFPVPAREAFDILATTNPEAADWWRKEAPHLLRRGCHLLFDEAACEPDWIPPVRRAG